MKKVLVLGGGFAGVQAAIDLQKSKLFDVTLVSNRDFFFLFPVQLSCSLEIVHTEARCRALHAVI